MYKRQHKRVRGGGRPGGHHPGNHRYVQGWPGYGTGYIPVSYTHLEEVIAALPAHMQKKMAASRDCKRLIDPDAVSYTHLLCYSEGIERDGSGPWDMMLGWLPYNMQGYNLGVKKNEITEAAMAAGFRSAEKRTGIYSTGNVDVDIFRK